MFKKLLKARHKHQVPSVDSLVSLSALPEQLVSLSALLVDPTPAFRDFCKNELTFVTGYLALELRLLNQTQPLLPSHYPTLTIPKPAVQPLFMTTRLNPDLIQPFMSIYYTHIQHGAPYPINLTAETRKSLTHTLRKAKMRKIKGNLYATVMDEMLGILKLAHTDFHIIQSIQRPPLEPRYQISTMIQSAASHSDLSRSFTEKITSPRTPQTPQIPQSPLQSAALFINIEPVLSVAMDDIAPPSPTQTPTKQHFTDLISMADNAFKLYCNDNGGSELYLFVEGCIKLETTLADFRNEVGVDGFTCSTDRFLRKEDELVDSEVPAVRVRTIDEDGGRRPPNSLNVLTDSEDNPLTRENPSEYSIVLLQVTEAVANDITLLDKTIHASSEDMLDSQDVTTSTDNLAPTLKSSAFDQLIDESTQRLYEEMYVPFVRDGAVKRRVRAPKLLNPNRISIHASLLKLDSSQILQDKSKFVDCLVNPHASFDLFYETVTFIKACLEIERGLMKDEGALPKTLTPSAVRFLSDTPSQSQVSDMPDKAVQDYIQLYADYLSADATHQITLPHYQLEKLESAFASSDQIRTNLFDEIIDTLMHSCFGTVYKPFVTRDVLADLPARALNQNRRSYGTQSTPMIPFHLAPQPTKKADSDMGRSMFVKTLQDQKSLAAFKAIAASNLCVENTKFYESFLQLEKGHDEFVRKYGKGEYVRLGTRFVTRERNDQPHECIPLSQVSKWLHFYSTFIATGSALEVNISDRLKRSIGEVLSGGLQRVPFNVFDEAADEVMLMLYSNTFKSYMLSDRVGLMKEASKKSNRQSFYAMITGKVE